jgi:quercetin dioxygenase-like cupin family protein
MQVIPNDSSRAERTTAPIFVGEVYRAQAVGETETKQLSIGLVRFAPGGRNVLHTHTFDQVLYITDGEGIVATEQEEHTVRAGDIAVIPAGERHWHGATERTGMTHLAIGVPGTTEIAQ